MARLERIAQIETPNSAPQYELRVRRHGPVGTEYEIWQMPATATPQVSSALRVAGLRGRNLDLVEHRVLKPAFAIRYQAGPEHGHEEARLCPHGRLSADIGAAVPHPCSDAQPR